MSIHTKSLVLSLLALAALQGCGNDGTDKKVTGEDMGKPAAAAAAASKSAGARAQSGRDYVYVVGSSTVYPFATVVAERFGRGSEFKTPKVESTGSGGRIKLFCDGVGVDHPDIANSSRAIEQSEVDSCAENGVTEIIEVKIGYHGIVIANALGSATVDSTDKIFTIPQHKLTEDYITGRIG